MYILNKIIKLRKGITERFDLPNLSNLGLVSQKIIINQGKSSIADLNIQINNSKTNSIIREFDKAHFIIFNDIDLNIDDVNKGIPLCIKIKYTGNVAFCDLTLTIYYNKSTNQYNLLSKQYMNVNDVFEDLMVDIMKYKNAKRVLLTSENEIKSIHLKSKFTVIKGKLWDNLITLYQTNEVNEVKEKIDIKYKPIDATDMIIKHDETFTYELDFTKLKNSRFFKNLKHYDIVIESPRSNILFMNIYGNE